MLRVRFIFFGGMVLLALTLVSSAQGTKNAGKPQPSNQAWRETFNTDKANLVDTGRNIYFILEPGYRLTFEHGKDSLIITVLDETKIVDGVKTRIIEERETEGGQLIEVSRNYFAIDKTTNDLYYFGEDVDMYKAGKVTSHEGSWLAGVNGAKFGLMMPAKPKVGDKYYQEQAPKVALDRAEIISVTETAKVPAGAFNNVLHTRESSGLESGNEDKWYAPDVGLIKDAEFVLAKVEKGKK
ncbi:MAG: hypothetical protein ABSH28_25470 [Acidobacteriota bacterium]